MKHMFPLLLLLWAVQAFSQEPLDSTFWEMEDSVSSLAIMPVKKPKKLLERVIKQVCLDIERKRVNAKYKVEATFGVGSKTPFTASCIFSADAGLDLENTKIEQFQYEGPFELSSQDSTLIKGWLFTYVGLSIIRPNQLILDLDGVNSPSERFRKIIAAFRHDVITAYSIRDDAGRGAYRISYEPENQKAYNTRQVGTAYFDAKTLHITQFKGKTTLPGYRTSISYQIDYDDKAPVVKQIKATGIGGKSVIKATVQRLKE